MATAFPRQAPNTTEALFEYISNVLKLVRKDLIPEGPEFQHELDNLTSLNLLRHPNILRFLGSYTYQKTSPHLLTSERWHSGQTFQGGTTKPLQRRRSHAGSPGEAGLSSW